MFEKEHLENFVERFESGFNLFFFCPVQNVMRQVGPSKGQKSICLREKTHDIVFVLNHTGEQCVNKVVTK